MDIEKIKKMIDEAFEKEEDIKQMTEFEQRKLGLYKKG